MGREYTARNPRRADRRPGSFRVNVNTGKWADFAMGDAGGDVVSLAAYLSGTSQVEAARALADMMGGLAGRRGVFPRHARFTGCPKFTRVPMQECWLSRVRRPQTRPRSCFPTW